MLLAETAIEANNSFSDSSSSSKVWYAQTGEWGIVLLG